MLAGSVSGRTGFLVRSWCPHTVKGSGAPWGLCYSHDLIPAPGPPHTVTLGVRDTNVCPQQLCYFVTKILALVFGELDLRVFHIPYY